MPLMMAVLIFFAAYIFHVIYHVVQKPLKSPELG